MACPPTALHPLSGTSATAVTEQFQKKIKPKSVGAKSQLHFIHILLWSKAAFAVNSFPVANPVWGFQKL